MEIATGNWALFSAREPSWKADWELKHRLMKASVEMIYSSSDVGHDIRDWRTQGHVSADATER